MANNFKVSVAARNAELDIIARLLDGGFLDIYDGTQPASPDVAVSTQVKLAHLAFSGTSAPASSAGSTTYNAITSDTNAAATSTATWFRATKTDGTAVCDGTVGTSSADAIINTTAIQQHARVDCTSLVISL